MTLHETRIEVCANVAACLLDKSVDRTLLFGPVVCRPSDGTWARQWYFHVVGCKRKGEIWNYQFVAQIEADTVEMRALIMAALVDQQSCVMIDFDDELERYPNGLNRGIPESVEV